MDLTDCIRAGRATREFADRAVADETVETLIDDARRAGSGHNRQPWTFVAVRDPDRRAMLAGFGEYTTPLRRAPVGIVMIVDENDREIHRRHHVFDAGRAAQNLMLTATAEGLGTVPQAFQDRAGAGEFLNVPADKEVLIGLAVGYPAETEDGTIEGVDKEEELDSMGRRPVSDVLYWETY
jgi:nitroreductase